MRAPEDYDGSFPPHPREGARAHQQTVSLRLKTLKGLMLSKTRWVENIIAGCSTNLEGNLTVLRGDAVFHIAEFLFLIRENDIRGDRQLKKMVEVHNHQIDALLDHPDKMIRFGKKRKSIENARFSEMGALKLCENFARRPPCFDQSDLSRFLINLMSPESCNRAVRTLVHVNLLERFETPYKSKVVHSPGTLETLYATYLDDISAFIQPSK